MAGFAIEDELIKTLTKDIPVSETLILLGLGGMIIFASLAVLKGEALF